MSFTDFMIITAILTGSGYLFYKSYIKKGGGCGSCKSTDCELKNLNKN